MNNLPLKCIIPHRTIAAQPRDNITATVLLPPLKNPRRDMQQHQHSVFLKKHQKAARDDSTTSKKLRLIYVGRTRVTHQHEPSMTVRLVYRWSSRDGIRDGPS